MRATVLTSVGAEPEVREYEDPPAGDDGRVSVTVGAAGLNPVDLYIASGQMGEPSVPSVVGEEGVGTLDDGRRVYFNPSVGPFGSWAERTLV
ncbi:MAG TPA: hypothetical protein VE127_08835, partial [Solirubrobacteraceae bacterium]|nr:hypothetical protein [Solirubrobacteraceae bacterium]